MRRLGVGSERDDGQQHGKSAALSFAGAVHFDFSTVHDNQLVGDGEA